MTALVEAALEPLDRPPGTLRDIAFRKSYNVCREAVLAERDSMVIADVDFVRNFVVVNSSVRAELQTTNQSFVLAVVESEVEGLTTLTLLGWTECTASSPLTSTAVLQSSFHGLVMIS